MKYATWKLNFTNPNYGTGPEAVIVEQGGTAEAGLANNADNKEATILGYFTGQATGLEIWSFTEITQQEALDFVLAFDATAFIDDDGKIGVVYPDDVI